MRVYSYNKLLFHWSSQIIPINLDNNENEKGHIYQSYKNRCSVENNCFITKLLLKFPEVRTPPPRLGTTALLCNDPANGDGYSSSLGVQVVLFHNENNVGRNICKHLLALGKIWRRKKWKWGKFIFCGIFVKVGQILK